MGNLGGPELLIILVLLVFPAVSIWGLVDAAVRPDWAWQQASQNKTLWIVLMAVGLVFSCVGFVLALVYLITVRPQLVQAQRAGGPR